MKVINSVNTKPVTDLSIYRSEKNKYQRKSFILTLIFVFIMVLMITLMGIWFWKGSLEESVPGVGQFVPEHKVRKINSPIDGIVSEIMVKESQRVKRSGTCFIRS